MASKIASSIILLALAATSSNAHAFFHTGYVNDVSQGHLFGVRAPSSNSPIEDVTSSALACNNPLHKPVSTDVISVAPGDTFGMQWNHNLAGPTNGDADDPIASSHKGPVIVYAAKVDDASSNDGSGLSWFKIAEEGLDTSTGKWGVDTLIAGAGLWSFTVPNLVAGDYLFRGEIIALHSAGSTGGAQFYMSCVAITVTGSGTCSPADTVSFPGAYSASDPGILINIYSGTGTPVNGGKAYTIPGPAIASCDGSSTGSSSSAVPASSTTTSAAVSLSASVTTAKNVASSRSSTTTTTSSSSVKATSAAATSSLPSAVSSSKSITTARSARPTTFVTSSRTYGHTGNNSTKPWESWTWSLPQQRTTPLGSLSPSASSVSPPTTSSQRSGHDRGSGSGSDRSSVAAPTAQASSSVAITASASETNVKVPIGSATAPSVEATGAAAPSVTGPGPATPSASEYAMIGPGGKKFLCYEVTDF